MRVVGAASGGGSEGGECRLCEQGRRGKGGGPSKLHFDLLPDRLQTVLDLVKHRSNTGQTPVKHWSNIRSKLSNDGGKC